MQISIVSLQFALFFRDLVERPDIDFGDMNIKMLNIFDAIPSIMPIPKELPPEIPVMSLRSESGEFSCNISRNRIDFYITRIGDEKKNTEILKDFNIKVFALCEYILKKKEVIRFGIIGRFFAQENNAIDLIRKRYFNNSFPNVSELGIRYNNLSLFEGCTINDIVELSSASLAVDGKEKFGIYIQRDVNNVPLEKEKLDVELLRKISEKYSNLFSEAKIEVLVK